MKPHQITASPLKVILIAGLVAGTMDILAACIQFYVNTGKDPQIVLKYVASGVFGAQKAFAGGTAMSAWGLLFHYIIATSFAAFFVFLYLRWKFITRNIILSGLIYGIFAWTIMNRIVVPLSKVKTPPFDPQKAIIAALILMFCIGLPIALITHNYLKRRSAVV